MEASKIVFGLLISEEDKLVELEAFLEEHKGVDVNLYQVGGTRSIHFAAYRGHEAYMSLLIEANADLEVRDNTGLTALRLASNADNLECLQVLIESKADVNAADDRGMTPGHGAAHKGHSKCLDLLLSAKADVNASTVHGGTPAMAACLEGQLTCLQLLVDAKADLNATANAGLDAVYSAMRIPYDEPTNRVPGMPFAVLSCDTDSNNVRIDDGVTQATVDAHLNEYTQIHNFIDDCHAVIKHALNENVVVDKRMGRRGNIMYGEPLEQVLLYLGLSMKKDQTVNASIDGKSGVKRALMPGHPTNANLWFELYQRTHCSSCGARPAMLKQCTCDTARYCNNNCQRKHWPTHKPRHKAVMLKKTLMDNKKLADDHKQKMQEQKIQEPKTRKQSGDIRGRADVKTQNKTPPQNNNWPYLVPLLVVMAVIAKVLMQSSVF
jgi:hypothetical protein